MKNISITPPPNTVPAPEDKRSDSIAVILLKNGVTECPNMIYSIPRPRAR